MAHRPFTLTKKERLKSRKLIDHVFSEGKSIANFPFRVHYLFICPVIPAVEPSLQCGFGVSTKNFKRAVDRNRIKRLTREAFRLQKALLGERLKTNQEKLCLFFIYTGKEVPDMNVVKEKMGAIIQKLIILTDENHSSNS